MKAIRAWGPVLLYLWLLALGPAATAWGGTVGVQAGESIAEALASAKPGTVIEVEPGVYHEALTVDTPGITLRGVVRGDQRPVLDGRGQLGDGVIASGSPFVMSGFQVQHYVGNGVTTQGVDGVILTDLIIDDTGLYGLYPVQSANIEVTHNTVTGIRDAGIYVGESNGALVAFNEVHRNVAGIEIENTNDAEVRDNLVYDNTAGIAVFVLPGKVQKEGLRTRVFRNYAVRNNRANFGDPESIIGNLPHGVGIFVMGADDTTIEDNQVKQNESAGIAVLQLSPVDAAKDPALEPHSDRTRVAFNYLFANGGAPHPDVLQGYGGGGDLMWDGTGVGNCADLSDAVKRRGAPLPRCSPQPVDRPVPGGRKAVAVPSAPADVPADGEGPVVRIRGMRFEPHEIEVAVGETVTWVNEDAVTHTVTSGTGATPTSAPLASSFLPRGGTYQFTFDELGEYEYLCLPHLDQAPMRGARVRVVKDGS